MLLLEAKETNSQLNKIKFELEGVWDQLEYSVNFSLDLMLLMCLSVLYVLLYAQLRESLDYILWD